MDKWTDKCIDVGVWTVCIAKSLADGKCGHSHNIDGKSCLNKDRC